MEDFMFEQKKYCGNCKYSDGGWCKLPPFSAIIDNDGVCSGYQSGGIAPEDNNIYVYEHSTGRIGRIISFSQESVIVEFDHMEREFNRSAFEWFTVPAQYRGGGNWEINANGWELAPPDWEKLLAGKIRRSKTTPSQPSSIRHKTPQTNGDKIRQMSNEELAEMLVYPVKPMNVNGNIHYEFTSCLLLGKSYPIREQAVFLTERRLNAPTESEGEDE